MDSLSVWSSVVKFPDQVDQVLKELSVVPIADSCRIVKNIVVSGMGGSALGGRIAASLERESLHIPIIVSTEFHLPNFVDQNTLVVISSYSGNTEETLASLSEAQSRNAVIFGICTGGKLAGLIKQKIINGYIIDPVNNPSNQPRMSLGYAVMSIVAMLNYCGHITLPENLSDLVPYLRSRQSESEKYLSLARHLTGRIPVFIVSEHLKGATHAIKNQINENAKNFVCQFDLPELNHHLLEGLTFPKTNPENLFFVFIKSNHYHPEVQKRYSLTEEAVKRQNIPYLEICLDGPNRFFETFELLQAAGYIGFYLSQANGVDPGPIPWVDWYKDEIRKVV